MDALTSFLHSIIGPDGQAKDLTFLQISLRGIVVFLLTLLMVRLSSKRSLAEKTAFDAVLIVIVASVLARAINGSAPFLASIGGGFVLVLLHRIFAWIACRSHSFGKLIKGSPVMIIESGQLNRPAMRRELISDHDLMEDLRLDAQVEEIDKIKRARLERSGDISFIKKDGS